MMLLVMGGKTATTNPFTISRANVLYAGNLAHEHNYVQFSSVHNDQILSLAGAADSECIESKFSKY